MPFERYLQPDNDDDGVFAYATQHVPQSSYPQSTSAPVDIDGNDAYRVPFQMPNFVFGGPPTLAPGGGAEVLPAGLISASPSSWFSQSAFSASTPKVVDPSPTHLYTPDSHTWSDHIHRTAFAHNPQEAAADAIQSLAAYPSSAVSNPSPASATRSGPSSPVYPAASLPLPWSNAPQLQPPQLLQQPLLRQPLASGGHPSYAAPPALGLPVYSSTGFDLLSVLARVVTRPNPKIMLGPVDMSCSFCVVDVRRYDCPIIYASPTFYRLTGYEEHEVIGRNCRFLQSPDGHVARGEQRRFVAPDAVEYLKKSLVADKECQTSIVNYRKDGSAFINLITVVPVAGGVNNSPDEADQVVYHVGFQVDLTEQPNAILQKLRDGTYMVNYSTQSATSGPSAPLSARDRRNRAYALSMSQDMRDLLGDSAFLSSVVPATAGLSDEALTDWADGNHPLSLALLSAIADSVLVLSLKGSFLYIAPAIAHILGYDASELVNKSLTDFCHPSDVVPLTRELKESSVPTSSADAQAAAAALAEAAIPSARAPVHSAPRPVNLLFRARAASGDYVWLECRGRLHIEPGKGRKAILLSARSRVIPRLPWNVVPSAPVRADGEATRAPEAWGMLSRSGTLIAAGQGVRDVLGWPLADAVGKTLAELAGDDKQAHVALDAALQRAAQGISTGPETVGIQVRTPSGSSFTEASVVLYPLPRDASVYTPLIVQFRAPNSTSTTLRSVDCADVFEEMAPGQDSSWQYALQQLKIENQRLAAEIELLEREASEAPSQQQQKPQGQAMMQSAPMMMQSPTGTAHLQDWGMTQGMPVVTQSLKRPWGGGGGIL